MARQEDAMHIQINTDRNIDRHERLIHHIEANIRAVLGRFTNQITRVEVHLSDENGAKSGAADKRCVMEARFAGRRPVAASRDANTLQKAYGGAARALLRKLEARLGRTSRRKGSDSIRTSENSGLDTTEV
jgi:hypothetical protein